MVILSKRWAELLAKRPETGMGYQVVSIRLSDGRQFDQTLIVEGQITQIRGRSDIPFKESDIADIVVTHDRWDFNAERR
jgi:hypothetical protein